MRESRYTLCCPTYLFCCLLSDLSVANWAKKFVKGVMAVFKRERGQLIKGRGMI